LEIYKPILPKGSLLLLGISKRQMERSVAPQKALAPQAAKVNIFKLSRIGWRYNGQIEIDQMAVVQGIALHGAYAVRVMAG